IGTGAGQGINVGAATVVLISGAGVTEQTGSTITAASLLLQGSGSFQLQQGNAVGTLAASTNGPITLPDTADRIVGAVSGTNGITTGNNPLTLSTNGSLVVNLVINTGSAAFVANTGATGPANDKVNVAIIVGGGATINGGNFADQFTITPSA